MSWAMGKPPQRIAGSGFEIGAMGVLHPGVFLDQSKLSNGHGAGGEGGCSKIWEILL
jgi:hypothetical protein